MRHALRVLVLLAMVTYAMPSSAQMTLRSDERKVTARVEYAGVTQEYVDLPLAPYGFLNVTTLAHVDNPDPEGSGASDAGAWQISQVVGSAFSASGGSYGNWQIVDLSTHYLGESQATFDFELAQTMNYSLDTWLDAGDASTQGWCMLAHYAPNQVVQNCPSGGELHVQGRLAPGRYEIDGWSRTEGNVESATGPTYTYFLTFSPLANPLINHQPSDTIVAGGATARFPVGTSVPAASLTFQWRRNGVLLANGGHVSGADTPTLTLTGTAPADAGWYEATVTNGSVEEPSRLAHLGITSTSGVATAHAPAGLALELAGANPFAARTTLRYDVARPGRITVAIYDVAGARVRTLLDGDVSAPGLVSWDGRRESGATAPNGLYFARLSSPAGVVHRTLALMR